MPTTQRGRLPRLSKMQVQKYCQMQIYNQEMSVLRAKYRDLKKRRDALRGEFDELFGDRVTFRMDPNNLLVRTKVEVDEHHVDAYHYNTWAIKRG